MAKIDYTPMFYSKLVFEDDYGFPFTLIQSLTYVSAVFGGTIVVPQGFQTDLASIPQILENILPRVGRYDKAAVVHDFLYQTAYKNVSRWEADYILNEAMRVCGVEHWKRWAIYYGVRMGGWCVWDKYRHQDAILKADDKTATAIS